MTRSDALVLDHLAGAIDADRLEDGLAQERELGPDEVTRALLLLHLDAALRGGMPPDGIGDRIMARIRERDRGAVRDAVLKVIRTRPTRRSRRVRWYAAAVAAALILGLAIAGEIQRTTAASRDPVAMASAISLAGGALTIAERRLDAAGTLPDQLIASAGDDGATLRWSDGSAAVISARSRLHRVGRDLMLDAGQARFTVQPHADDAPFTVLTPHGTVAVIGTIFTLAVDSATTCAVERGTVAFRTAGAIHRLGAGMAMRAADAATTAMTGWRLVWSDEFAAPGPPDGERWMPWPRPSGINSDIQHYLDRRAQVEDGGLVITAHHEPSGWTSASLLARNLLVKPGMRIEMRARMPAAPGAWPLLWAVQAKRWPEGPEVVLLTSTGDPVRLRASTRFGSSFQPAFGPEVTRGFSNYAISWTTAGVRVERDGELMVAAALPADPGWAAACSEGLQLALELTVTAHDATSQIDQRWEVRYLRVYEQGPPP